MYRLKLTDTMMFQASSLVSIGEREMVVIMSEQYSILDSVEKPNA